MPVIMLFRTRLNLCFSVLLSLFSLYAHTLCAQKSPKFPYVRQAEKHPKTVIKWENPEFDFGELQSGQAVIHRFEFQNTGRHPLFITNVKASCGCVATEWSRQPVKPGAKGFVTMKLDTSGRSGSILKTLTLTANTRVSLFHVLVLKGYILPTDY